MADHITECIVAYYRRTHELVLEVAGSLDDQQMRWQPNRTTPCIGFHVWHLARWADHFQAMITEIGGQIWDKEELVAQWGLDDTDLGVAESGLDLDDDASASLPLPGKDVLLDYARRAFAEAARAAATIDDDQFHHRVQDRWGDELRELAIGDALVGWLSHAGRHLGMIECLVGAQGMRGTATR